MPSIVTLTVNPAVDKNSAVQQVVAERKLRCEEPEYHPGGGGLNVARAITELGGEALAYWACGGPVGQLLEQLLIRELGQLASREVEDDAQIRDVARSLIDQGKIQAVVTSLGSGGAVLTTADEHQHVRAPTVNIRSKVGAGDSTVAGLVFALSQGKPLDEALRFGVAAGSAAVMTGGTELCRREDTERLYREMQ